MRYFKFTCDNGYCGCDEEFYRAFDDNVTETELSSAGDEILFNEYTGYYDWFQCIDDEDNYDSEEDYQETIEEYWAECSFWFDEISQEQFEMEA